MIIFNILGFEDLPKDLKLSHGHIMRHFTVKDITSPFVIKYANMILDEDIFQNDYPLFEKTIDELIELIYSYKK